MEVARQGGRISPRDLSLSELPSGLDAKTLSCALFARYRPRSSKNLWNFLILFRNAPSTLIDHSVNDVEISCTEVTPEKQRGPMTFRERTEDNLRRIEQREILNLWYRNTYF